MEILKKYYSRRNILHRLKMLLVDTILWPISLFRRKKGINNILPLSILICHPAHLGDILMTTVLISLIKKVYPNSKISYLSGSWSAQLLENHRDVQRIHYIDHWKSNRSEIGGIQKIFRYLKTAKLSIKEIRKHRYDIAIVPYEQEPSLIPVLSLCNIPIKIGHSAAGFTSLLTVYNTNQASEYTHETKRLVAPFVKFSGINIEDSDIYTDIGISLEAMRSSFLASKILYKIPDDYIVIHPGTSAREREWPETEWSKLIKYFEGNNKPIVFTGYGANEINLITRLQSVLPKNSFINLVNKLDWVNFVAVINSASMVIGVESLAGHIAGSLGVPFIGVYTGIAGVDRWRPLGNKSKVFSLDMKCSPCRSRWCAERPCLTGIHADDLIKYLNNTN